MSRPIGKNTVIIILRTWRWVSLQSIVVICHVNLWRTKILIRWCILIRWMCRVIKHLWGSSLSRKYLRRMRHWRRHDMVTRTERRLLWYHRFLKNEAVLNYHNFRKLRKFTYITWIEICSTTIITTSIGSMYTRFPRGKLVKRKHNSEWSLVMVLTRVWPRFRCHFLP